MRSRSSFADAYAAYSRLDISPHRRARVRLQTVSEAVVVGGGDDDGRHWQLSFTEIYQLVLEGGAPVFLVSPYT